jgi:hypothetical protein
VERYECCKNVDKDPSTLIKHWVSNTHFKIAVGERRMCYQPVYTCPAFLSMHGLCRNAKYVPPTVLFFAFFPSILMVASRAGRYDSASRHCKACPGFQQIRAESWIKVTPVQLLRGEHDAVQEFRVRKEAQSGQGTYSEPILNAVFKVLMMMAASKTGPVSAEIPISEPSDEHAGVLTADEELGLFTSNELVGDGVDGIDSMFQV